MRIPALAFFAALALGCGALAQPQAPPPACDTPEYRAFDFWLGEWEVRNPQGHHVGDNRIEAILNGCVLLESWTSVRGGAGRSFNIYNPVEKIWRQFWVDSSGGAIDYARGQAVAGGMRFEGEQLTAAGRRLLSRMTFTVLEPGRVRQLIERSADGGRSWEVWFDGTYIRRAPAKD